MHIRAEPWPLVRAHTRNAMMLKHYSVTAQCVKSKREELVIFAIIFGR